MPVMDPVQAKPSTMVMSRAPAALCSSSRSAPLAVSQSSLAEQKRSLNCTATSKNPCSACRARVMSKVTATSAFATQDTSRVIGVGFMYVATGTRPPRHGARSASA